MSLTSSVDSLVEFFPRFFAAVWESQTATPTNEKITKILSIGFPASCFRLTPFNAADDNFTMTTCQS